MYDEIRYIIFTKFLTSSYTHGERRTGMDYVIRQMNKKDIEAVQQVAKKKLVYYVSGNYTYVHSRRIFGSCIS